MSKYIYEINPGDFKIVACDCAKKNQKYSNYFNLGFFAQGDGVTIPVGNLAADGKIIAQAKTNASWLNTAGHKLTTIYTTKDGKCGITKTDDLSTIKDLNTAVSGVPIVKGGKKVTMEEIKSEGYFGNETYDTWHGFLGIKNGNLVYVGLKCGFDDMYNNMMALGIQDAVKLDGGGSFILKTPDTTIVTEGNRRIHNIGVFEPIKTQESESDKDMNILLIPGHGDGDVGAVGNGCKEADLTREQVQLIKTELQKYKNVTVDIADPSKNWYQYVCKKGGKLNAKPYGYVLESHFNAIKAETASDGATKGTEIYVTTSEKGISVEQAIVDNIASLGFKNRGVKRYNWGLISNIKKQGVSAALLETCFIDDIDDMKIYKAKKKEIAQKVAEGIATGFGLKKTENKTESKTETKTETEPEKTELSDIKGHWAEQHIKKLLDYGVVNGYPDGTFKPDKAITRAEVATIVANALTVCGK